MVKLDRSKWNTKDTPDDEVLTQYLGDSYLWGFDVTFMKATDEKRAAWLEFAKAVDEHNDRARDCRNKLYKQLLELAERLWGRRSNEYKYLARARLHNMARGYWVSRHRRLMEDIEKAQAEKEREKKEREERNTKQQAEQDDIVALLLICVRREFQPIPEASYVMDCLESLSPHLALANEMQRTRNEFSNGIKGIRQLLDKLPEDHHFTKAIKEDIQECFEYWDGDGRIFRDTKWNYDAIYELVPEDLMKDARVVDEILEMELYF